MKAPTALAPSCSCGVCLRIAALAVLGHTAASSSAADAGPCGLKGDSSNLQSRIVNGVEASRCEWPWQAALYDASADQFCGGTLIAPQWVLTAAHCVFGGDFFFVTLGDHNLAEVEGEQVNYHVDRVIMHPNYVDDDSYDYDFALVKLASPATLGDCVRTACLPEADEELPHGDVCYTTGWGDTTGDKDWPDKLQETSVTLMEDAECKSSYGAGEITDVMFCAAGSRNGEPTDSCQGDSGGPLVCAGEGDAYTLHGVVSWGYGCAEETPGVYASVAPVLPWITTYLEEAPAPAPAPSFPAGSMWTVTEGACTLDDNFCVMSPNYPADYPDDSACIIHINSSLARPIQLEYFHTEHSYDGLLVNFQFYSGGLSPAGVVPEGAIVWQADGDEARPGWKLCQEPPTFDNGASWILAGGDCEMDENECVTSPNFPSQYAHGDEEEGFCNIIVNPSLASPLHVEYFETEADWDLLWVSGTAYGGREGPAGVVPSGVIGWSPDDAEASRGWMICPGPRPACPDCFSGGSAWKVTGPCKVDGDCVESSSYGQSPGYGNSEDCFMELNPAYSEPIRVEGFHTEADFDVLVVNNAPYSGSNSPDGVTAESSILTWTSDEATAAGKGWRLCASRPTTTGDLTTLPFSDSTTLPSFSDLTTLASAAGYATATSTGDRTATSTGALPSTSTGDLSKKSPGDLPATSTSDLPATSISDPPATSTADPPATSTDLTTPASSEALSTSISSTAAGVTVPPEFINTVSSTGAAPADAVSSTGAPFNAVSFYSTAPSDASSSTVPPDAPSSTGSTRAASSDAASSTGTPLDPASSTSAPLDPARSTRAAAPSEAASDPYEADLQVDGVARATCSLSFAFSSLALLGLVLG